MTSERVQGRGRKERRGRAAGDGHRGKVPRHKFPLVSEEMKAWSTALAGELTGWPGVSTKPMFGFSALYRGKRIFAVLPRTRGMGSANSLAFKLDKAGPRVLAGLREEKRISTTVMRASRWFVFELSSDADLRDALGWLGRAYESAG